jgi:hypothetical protein
MGILSLAWNCSAVDVVADSIALVLAYVVSTAIYRLYLHPLAKYPGPFWARLTVFPSYWHTLQRDRHIWLWRLQEEYGTSLICIE